MAEYLAPADLDISIDEKKWIFKTRTEDIDLHTNIRWMKDDTKFFKFIHLEMDQRHLLNCIYLFGKCEIVIYIPDYDDIHNGTIEEMLYIARIIKDNFKTFNTLRTM